MRAEGINDPPLAEGGQKLAETAFGGIEGFVALKEGDKDGEDNILKIRRGHVIPSVTPESSQHADAHRMVVEVKNSSQEDSQSRGISLCFRRPRRVMGVDGKGIRK